MFNPSAHTSLIVVFCAVPASAPVLSPPARRIFFNCNLETFAFCKDFASAFAPWSLFHRSTVTSVTFKFFTVPDNRSNSGAPEISRIVSPFPSSSPLKFPRKEPSTAFFPKREIDCIRIYFPELFFAASSSSVVWIGSYPDGTVVCNGVSSAGVPSVPGGLIPSASISRSLGQPVFAASAQFQMFGSSFRSD